MPKIFTVRACKATEKRVDRDFKKYAKVYNEIWGEVDKVLNENTLPRTVEDRVKLFAMAMIKHDVLDYFVKSLELTRDNYEEAINAYNSFFKEDDTKPTDETAKAFEKNRFMHMYLMGLIAEVNLWKSRLKETERKIYNSFDLEAQTEIAKGVDMYYKKLEKDSEPKDLECSAR